MAQYRKKPVVIEAVQFHNDGREHPLADVMEFTRDLGADRGVGVDSDGRPQELRIATLEGVMTASPGDWIIRGVKGEYYPCKPHIFAATYEPAAPAPSPPPPEQLLFLKDTSHA